MLSKVTAWKTEILLVSNLKSKYVEIAKKRIEAEKAQLKLF